MAWIRWFKRWYKWISIAVIVSFVLSVILIEFNVRPILLSMAESRARSMAVEAINAAILECSTDISYDDLITVLSDNDGHITLIKTNSAIMNELSARASIIAQRSLSQTESQRVGIPIGSMTGIELLAGWGPRIWVDVIPVGAVVAEYVTEFTSGGINQTRHRIFLKLTANMNVLAPTGSNPVSAAAQMLIAESIIVGQVPDSYLSGSRDDVLDLVPD